MPRGCHRRAWVRGSLFASSVTRARLYLAALLDFRLAHWLPQLPRLLFDFAQAVSKANTRKLTTTFRLR
jgi:hypothetical protein